MATITASHNGDSSQPTIYRVLDGTVDEDLTIQIGTTDGNSALLDMTVVMLDVSNTVKTLVDEKSGDTIVVIPAMQQWWIDMRLMGGNFQLVRAGQLP